jgi:S1-C subfamily serine protease
MAILIGVLALGILLGQFIASTSYFARAQQTESLPRDVTVRPSLAADEVQRIQLYKSLAPSVVFISTIADRVDMFGNVDQIRAGTGTGFMWDDQGHIVTNYHVVLPGLKRGPRGIEVQARVTLSDQSTFDATLVGVAPSQDLAVVKIDAPKEKLNPIPLGSSNDLQVGQSVMAIGNPFGLDQTLTTGVISALGRRIMSPANIPIEDVVQTDAAINPGNSGGPLLDSAGLMIGVNTAIASRAEQSAGISFAVPVDTVNRIVPQLIQFGMVKRPVIGVQLANERVNAMITRMLGVQGVVIAGLDPSGPAAKADMVPIQINERRQILDSGDVITEVNGRKVTNIGELLGAVQRFDAGTDVTLTLWRNKQVRQVSIKLQEERSGN